MAQRFPLIRLPFLCIQDIVNFWNEFEILRFSLISRRTQFISKSIKRRFEALEAYILGLGSRLVLVSGNVRRTFYLVDDCMYRLINRPRRLPSPHDFIETVKQVFEIFKAENRTVELRLSSVMGEEELNKFFDTLSSSQEKINKLTVHFHTESAHLFNIFMNRLSINVTSFSVTYLYVHSKRQRPVDPIESITYFQCYVFKAVRSMTIFPLDSSLRANCNELILWDQEWRYEDLNQVLKLWMEGTMHEEVRRCTLDTYSSIPIKYVLNGLNAKLRDPRTSVETFQVTIGDKLVTIQVRGGICLTRNDGKQILISFLELSEYLNTEVTHRMIDQYENMVIHWEKNCYCYNN